MRVKVSAVDFVDAGHDLEPQPPPAISEILLRQSGTIVNAATILVVTLPLRDDLAAIEPGEGEREQLPNWSGERSENSQGWFAGKLQAAGFVIETLLIQPAEPQAPHQHFGVNVPSTGHDQFTGQANGGPSAHDRPSNHDDGQRSRPIRADDAQDGAGVRYIGGDLYVGPAKRQRRRKDTMSPWPCFMRSA
jgi:hypothetical protein